MASTVIMAGRHFRLKTAGNTRRKKAGRTSFHFHFKHSENDNFFLTVVTVMPVFLVVFRRKQEFRFLHKVSVPVLLNPYMAVKMVTIVKTVKIVTIVKMVKMVTSASSLTTFSKTSGSQPSRVLALQFLFGIDHLAIRLHLRPTIRVLCLCKLSYSFSFEVCVKSCAFSV